MKKLKRTMLALVGRRKIVGYELREDGETYHGEKLDGTFYDILKASTEYREYNYSGNIEEVTVHHNYIDHVSVIMGHKVGKKWKFGVYKTNRKTGLIEFVERKR